jgi:hypothetical protein
VLKDWPQTGVVGLVRDLYALSDENRSFLHARLLESAKPETLDAVKCRLARLLSPEAIYANKFKHVEVKRIIDRYAKASDAPAEVADLLVTDLSHSLAALGEVGDFEPMVDHIYAVMERLDKILPLVERAVLLPLVERLCELADQWHASFGYGVSDELETFAEAWRERAGLKPRPQR